MSEFTHTRCPHCGIIRDPDKCRADPYINKEPREYCPLAPSLPDGKKNG